MDAAHGVGAVSWSSPMPPSSAAIRRAAGARSTLSSMSAACHTTLDGHRSVRQWVGRASGRRVAGPTAAAPIPAGSAGSAMHRHHHPNDEVWHVLDGELEATLGEAVGILHAGLVVGTVSSSRACRAQAAPRRVVVVADTTAVSASSSALRCIRLASGIHRTTCGREP